MNIDPYIELSLSLVIFAMVFVLAWVLCSYSHAQENYIFYKHQAEFCKTMEDRYLKWWQEANETNRNLMIQVAELKKKKAVK